MTELQFLLELLLKHKLSKETKQLVADRIGEVELKLRGNPGIAMARSMEQAPSTIAAMAAQAAPVALPPAAARLVGGEVNNGDGTRGKRKF